MPRVFDNIEQDFVSDLRALLVHRSSFPVHRFRSCVDYFRPHGWGPIADLADKHRGGGDSCCRVLGWTRE
jgi:hypothetical protein